MADKYDDFLDSVLEDEDAKQSPAPIEFDYSKESYNELSAPYEKKQAEIRTENLKPIEPLPALDQYDEFLDSEDTPPKDELKFDTDYSIRPEIFTENLKKGWADFASIPGYAFDLINYPMNKLGLTEETSALGSDKIREGWNLITGYTPVKPTNASEEYAAKAAEFVGSGLLMSGKLGTEAAKFAISKADKFIAYAKAFGTDVASSASAGVGAESMGAVFEQGLGKDMRGTGEAIGGMSASMMPYYIRNLGGGVSNVIKTSRNPDAQEKVLNNAAKSQITNAIGNNPYAEINLQRAIELQKEIRGFNPNLAAATGAPGLKAFQESLDSKSVENFNRSNEAIEGSINAIDRYYRSKLPEVADKIMPSMRSEYQKRKLRLNQNVKKLDEQKSAIEGGFERFNAELIGNKLIDKKNVLLKAVKKEKSKKYDELYQAADDLNINMQVDDIRILAKEITDKDANAFQSMPGVYDKINKLFPEKLDDVGEQIQNFSTFPKVHSLMREVNTEYGKALASRDSAKEFYLNKIRGLVDDKLAAFDDPVFGNFANHKKATDQWWKDEYYNVFKQGFGQAIDYKTIRGEMTRPEMIVESLVLGKGTKGLAQFNKLYEGIPEAQTLLRDGIIDSLAKKISKDGLNQKIIDRFVSKNNEVLKNIPDLKNSLNDSSTAIAIIAERRRKAINASKKFIDTRSSKYAEIAGFENLQEAINAGFKDKTILTKLLSNAKTKTQKQDIATGMGDYILSNKDPWKFIEENGDIVKPWLDKLGPGHYKNVKNVAEAYGIMGRYATPKLANKSSAVIDPVKKTLGTSLTSVFAQMRWAFFYGKTSVVYPFVDIGSKYLFKLNQNAVEKLIEQSVYDPDLAKIMSTLTKKDKVPLSIWKNLSQIALNNGINAASVGVATTTQSEEEKFNSVK